MTFLHLNCSVFEWLMDRKYQVSLEPQEDILGLLDIRHSLV